MKKICFIVSGILFSAMTLVILCLGDAEKTLAKEHIENKKSGNFELIFQKGHADDAWCVMSSPDGKFIASGSKDKTVKLWDMKGRLIRIFKGHSGRVRSVSFSKDGEKIASISEDESLKVWDISGKNIRSFKIRKIYITFSFQKWRVADI